MRRIVSTLVPLAFAGATAVLPLACADGGTVDQGFQKQSGAGGAGGAGGATAASVSQSASSSDAASTTTTGPSTTATSTSATSTTSTSTTSSSTGGSCVDPGTEPNETEAKATFLDNITDCDGSGGQVDGVLSGPNDVDWYRHKASDTLGCSVDPTRSISAVGSIRLCKFFECLSDAPSFSCPQGTVAATSPDGRPGCCGLEGFSVDFCCGSCAFGSDDAQVYIRIDNPDQVACLPYQLAYHY
jgi:hypothetical protein